MWSYSDSMYKMNRFYFKKIFEFASSGKLTVGILAYSVILVFFATLAQTQIGIESAKVQFFEGFFPVFRVGAELDKHGNLVGGFPIFLLGGAVVGILAFINIIASGIRYVTFGVRGFGISICHMALALLLLSGALQYFMRTEALMRLREGETSDVIYVNQIAKTLPFKVMLKDFKEEKWTGSSIAKSYKSDIVFIRGSEKTEAVVEMNAPAGFGGWVFYQMSYADGGKTSVLAAVRNPARLLPWLAVGATFFGMLVIFLPRVLSGRKDWRK